MILPLACSLLISSSPRETIDTPRLFEVRWCQSKDSQAHLLCSQGGLPAHSVFVPVNDAEAFATAAKAFYADPPTTSKCHRFLLKSQKSQSEKCVDWNNLKAKDLLRSVFNICKK